MPEKIDAVYNRRALQLRQRATTALSQRYVERDDFEDEAGWLDEARPIAQGGTSAAASLASAWIAYKLGTAAIALSERATEPYRYDQRYTTPQQASLAALGQGADHAQALDAGAKRAGDVLDVDMQWSGIRGAREQGDAAGVKGWRRIPEDNACELCLLAADRTYKTEDLAPLHRDCGCWVEPVT